VRPVAIIRDGQPNVVRPASRIHKKEAASETDPSGAGRDRQLPSLSHFRSHRISIGLLGLEKIGGNVGCSRGVKGSTGRAMISARGKSALPLAHSKRASRIFVLALSFLLLCAAHLGAATVFAGRLSIPGVARARQESNQDASAPKP